MFDALLILETGSIGHEVVNLFSRYIFLYIDTCLSEQD